jgi:hypothetical protein
MLETDRSDATMASLAAGPLEYLLTVHGEHVIDQLEARAREDTDFRRLLVGIWKHGIPKSIRARIEAIWGDPW